MWRDHDLMDALADDPPGPDTALSEWLGEQDVEHLAAIAREARRADTSFGRRLRAAGRGSQ
jgi:hypothetical protein